MSFVLMVEPVCFGSKPEITEDNKFISASHVSNAQAGSDEAQAFSLLKEIADRVTYEGVPTEIIHLRREPKCFLPEYTDKGDAIFPNNSISFHNFTNESGKVVRRLVIIYPMSKYRQGELPKRQLLKKLFTLAEQRSDVEILDLREYEGRGRALEGTGALVFSHDGKYVYMARSRRSDEGLLDIICRPEYLNIPPENRFVFDAWLPQPSGNGDDQVYHTNVVGWCGRDVCAWCLEALKFPTADERDRFHNHLMENYEEIISLSPSEVRCFAGNVFEFATNRYSSERRFLCISESAWASLAQPHVDVLNKRYGAKNIFHFFAEAVERRTGGSVRCLLGASITHGPVIPGKSEKTLLELAGIAENAV